MIGIYKVINPKNKIYIGQSTDILKRFRDYKSLNCQGQPKLYYSLKKYGVENHKFEIVTECTIEELNNFERYYQDLYNVLDNKLGLNCKLTASNDRSGKHSEESKLKMSEAQKNRSEETLKKMSEAQKGKIKSEDSKRKTSESLKGRIFNNEHRFKISQSNKGKILSNETKLKMKENHWTKRQTIKHPKGNTKMVIDLETGFFYDSGVDAFEHNKDYLKMTKYTFTSKLNGNLKNNTKFQYI